MQENGIVYRNGDSYCGPISMLVRLPDGEVLLTFREARWREKQGGRGMHFDPTTRTSLIRSGDRGTTWRSQVSPDPNGGNGTSIARLSNGELLASDFRWAFAVPEERHKLDGMYGQAFVERVGMYVALDGVYVARSRTDGYTWEPAVKVPGPEGWTRMSTAGAVIDLPDGDLLMPLTIRRDEGSQSHAMVLRSSDKGLTWGEPVCVTEGAETDLDFGEMRLALCPSGRLLAMHRTREQYYRTVSTDGGRTWSETKDAGLWCGGSSPPDMLVLADGRLLLTRGYRREPFGVRCHLSEDEGDTWAREIVLRDDGLDRDVGYPSTVQFDDGGLLTVYYWHNEDFIRHLQRTSWELPE